ncbi:MAG: RAD55 family ATPase, partial [Haloferacaceae archaeon]
MPDEREKVGTGEPVLDGMLRGGLPENRAVLVTGGPGTGKSTLAMQFLQAGLERGETALYVSTEQTIEELRD